MVDSGKRSEFGNRLRFNSKRQLLVSKAPLSEATDQHIFAISKEKICPNDWYLFYMDENPELMECRDQQEADRCNTHPNIERNCFKIVVTSDINLTINWYAKETSGVNYLPHFTELFMNDFAIAYNQKQPITAIDLEVEQLCHQTGIPCGVVCNWDCEVNAITAVKTDKDGYAIIVPVACKKEIFTRAEVADIVRAYREFTYKNGSSLQDCEKFIEDNL